MRLEGLEGVTDAVLTHIGHGQKLLHSTGEAACTSSGKQGNARDAKEMRRVRCLLIHERAISHGTRSHHTQPSNQSRQHHLLHDHPELGHPLHESLMLQPVLFCERGQGPDEVRLSALVKLWLVIDVGVEGGARVFDGLAHLLAAKVVDFVASVHQRAGHRQGGVDVARGHREDEGEALRHAAAWHGARRGEQISNRRRRLFF
mmetsp:Transcript_33954/g.85833  ORF Transcript_33954/g.85833 Transcript_33954/m.85833 type:complete len:203 (+) Transcript_33954:1244-1852(+)